jgi:glutamate 5-kinase
METIIVKIGSESLKNFGTSEKVNSLVKDISRRIQDKSRILLVSSGAVQFGREYSEQIENKQVLAAIGWPRLIQAYANKFIQKNIGVASFLVTHADIEDYQDRAKTFIETIQATWESGILPIVNENDPLSTEEMREVGRGADNDKNALLLARLFDASIIFLITNTNGVYSNPIDPNSRIQHILSSELTDTYIDTLCSGKSTA